MTRFGEQLDLEVSLITVIVFRLGVQQSHNFLRRLAVAIHILDHCLEHVEVELGEQSSNLRDLFDVRLIDQIVVAVLDDELRGKTLEVDHVEDATRTVTHMLIDTPLVIAGEDEQLLRGEHAIKQSQDSFLLVVVIHLLKLIKENDTGLIDVSKELVESITSPAVVNDNGRNVKIVTKDRQLLSEQCLTRTLLTGQHNTSAGRTFSKRTMNTVRVLQAITVILGQRLEPIGLFEIEIAYRILLDDVVACRKQLVEIQSRFIRHTICITRTKEISHK